MQGRIIKQISNDYWILADNKEYICKPRGKLRKIDSPIVGDIVNFDEKNNYILDILKRKNELNRPRISNIDQCLIVQSVKDPDLDLNLLDKLLCILEFNNIEPIIVFSKVDLLKDKNEFNKIFNYYQKYYQVYLNTDDISKIFKNKYTVITGQSGAGKSTLLNKLDPNFKINTSSISKALGRGKHTTRHTQFYKVYDGYVADTPGFSSLEFTNMSKSDIRDGFRDFNLYRNKCKYADCMHDKEDNCYIKDLVKEKIILQSRYENYLKFISK